MSNNNSNTFRSSNETLFLVNILNTMYNDNLRQINNLNETLNNLNLTTNEKQMFEFIDTIYNIIEFTNDNLFKLSLKYSTSVYDKIKNTIEHRGGIQRWHIQTTKKKL